MNPEIIEINSVSEGVSSSVDRFSSNKKRSFLSQSSDAYQFPKKKRNENENDVEFYRELIKRKDEDFKKLNGKYNVERLKGIKGEIEKLRAEYMRIKEDLVQSEVPIDSTLNLSVDNEPQETDSKLDDLHAKIAELENLLAEKEGQLNLREKRMDNLYAENRVAKKENEKLRSMLELNGGECEGKQQQVDRLKEKLAAKDADYKRQSEQFEGLKAEKKVLADKFKKQKSDFERQRYDESFSSANAKSELEDLRGKNKKLEGLLKTKKEQINQYQAQHLAKEELQKKFDEENLKLDQLRNKNRDLEETVKTKEEQINFHRSAKEKLLAIEKELENLLEDKEDFISVSKTTLYFDGKIGTTRELVMSNITDDRIAFMCESLLLPFFSPITVSPGRGILNAKEEKTISVKCKKDFKFTRITIHSLKVPEGGGNTLQMAWFREDPSKIKMTNVFCKKLK